MKQRDWLVKNITLQKMKNSDDIAYILIKQLYAGDVALGVLPQDTSFRGLLIYRDYGDMNSITYVITEIIGD